MCEKNIKDVYEDSEEGKDDEGVEDGAEDGAYDEDEDGADGDEGVEDASYGSGMAADGIKFSSKEAKDLEWISMENCFHSGNPWDNC